MATTGDDVVVTWANAQETVDAWMTETYYDKPDGAERLIARFGGTYGTDVETIPASRRDDFCATLRYIYGACINLRQSRALDPKVFNKAQIEGQKK